ncbi:Xanthone prenyltransferase A [Colletotrichum orbiculare MAFF 240422]|uniref:Xanthone prenyltransferase A n=2 Tax=Colletotrichum orbiculare species complex TaxID=2707354 RepID=A0A484FPC4_COLOR|nr:Xanthone prenyltransferase A [Colletotrichum orbiculare MAFF 240422]
MTVFNHFISKLYDPAWHKYLETDERPIMTNVCLGFEFLNREILPKAYFFPRKLGQVGLTPIDVWEEALTAAAPQSLTMSTVFSFIKQDSAELGLTLTPLWLGIDVVRPADARLKLCCAEARTSFESVMSVLTMDGRINIEPDLVEQTWGIMKAVCDLPAGFPRSQVPKAPKYNASVDGIDTAGLWGTFFYYFDTGIGREELPDIKFYIPVCHYRADDEAIASATASWMRNHGRDQYVDAYWNTLRAIITHRSLGESRGAHMWLSMMVRGGKLQATSYIAPEGYHLKRLGGRERPQNAIAERVTRDF